MERRSFPQAQEDFCGIILWKQDCIKKARIQNQPACTYHNKNLLAIHFEFNGAEVGIQLGLLLS